MIVNLSIFNKLSMFNSNILPIVREIHNRQAEIRRTVAIIEAKKATIANLNYKNVNHQEYKKILMDEMDKLNHIDKLIDEIKEFGIKFSELTNKDKTLAKLYHSLVYAEDIEDYIKCAEILNSIKNHA